MHGFGKARAMLPSNQHQRRKLWRSKASCIASAAVTGQLKNPPMWYGNTKSQLESIVRWLSAEVPRNDAEWQTQTELVQACLAEMVGMSEPTVNPSKGVTSRYVHRPAADKLNPAMPHVRSMFTAMRDRDRTTALAHGETTLRRL